MATYDFNSITPEQALAIRSDDMIVFAAGPANLARVVFEGGAADDLGLAIVTFGRPSAPGSTARCT